MATQFTRARGGGMSGLPVGRAFGIPIRFHWSWLLLFGIISWSLAGYFGFQLAGFGGPFGRRVVPPPVIPGMGRTEGLFVLGAATALLFGLSLLAHEMAHSLMAKANGIRVRGITLFFFGGVAEITSQPRTAGAEFRIAVVGPLTSLALAALFWAVSHWPDLPRTLTVPGAWLAQTNFMLAAFNLLPGFPLDGGRVFRSAIWQVSGNARRATQLAAWVGRLVGFGFIGWGVYSMLQGGVMEGLWQIFIGTFLQNAAVSQAAQSNAELALHGLTVEQALGPDPARDAARVPADLSLAQLVETHVLRGGHRVFLICDFGLPMLDFGNPAGVEPLTGGERRQERGAWGAGERTEWPSGWQASAPPSYEVAYRTPEVPIRGVLTLEDIRRVPRERWPLLRAGDVALSPSRGLASVTERTPLLEALRLMEERQTAQVAVVDEGDPNRLRGVLTRERAAAYLRLRHELGV